MADYLAIALDKVPRELIGPDALADLIALGKKLPPGFGKLLFGFECRLGENEPSVDIAASLAGDNFRRDMFKELLEHPLFNIHARFSPAWENLRTLINGYLDKNSILSKCLQNIILEFDRETASENHPLPGVFLGLKQYVELAEIRLKENATQNTNFGVSYRAMSKGLDIIGGNKISIETRKTLEKFYRQLTPPTTIFQAGVMLSRNTTPVKICIGNIERIQIISFLKSIGWQGDYKTLEQVIGIWGNMFDDFGLSIDISAGILPKLGLECYFHPKKQSDQARHRHMLVERLVRESLCTSGKGEALLSFNTREQYFPTPVFEDSNYSTPVRLPRYPLLMIRGLYHLKFIIELEKPLSVKAYLWARVKPII